ncbi:hypothetical protein Tco_0715450 [Tanacetum coccineum]
MDGSTYFKIRLLVKIQTLQKERNAQAKKEIAEFTTMQGRVHVVSRLPELNPSKDSGNEFAPPLIMKMHPKQGRGTLLEKVILIKDAGGFFRWIDLPWGHARGDDCCEI